jgi:hypothetical protein
MRMHPRLIPPPPTPNTPLQGYFAWTFVSDKFGLGKTKAKKAKKAEGPVVLDEDDWVRGTHYEVQKRRRAAAAKKEPAKA